MLDPMPDVHQVFGIAIKLERQLHGLSSQVDFAQAKATQSNYVHNETVATIGSFDQNFRGRFSNAKGRSTAKCTHCNMIGHTVDKCYKKHGYPARWIL